MQSKIALSNKIRLTLSEDIIQIWHRDDIIQKMCQHLLATTNQLGFESKWWPYKILDIVYQINFAKI